MSEWKSPYQQFVLGNFPSDSEIDALLKKAIEKQEIQMKHDWTYGYTGHQDPVCEICKRRKEYEEERKKALDSCSCTCTECECDCHGYDDY